MISPSSFSASQSWFSLHLMSSPPSCSASQSWFSLRFMSSFPSFSGVPIVHYLRFHFFALLVPRGDVLYDFRVFMIFLYLCTYIQVSNTISCRLSVIQWVTPVIIVILVKKSHQRKQLGHAHWKGNDVTRPTTMLLTIMVTYILFVTPIGIVHIIANYIGINFFGINMTSFLVFRDIAQILELFNYTVNFFLYVCSSSQFRHGVLMLLCSHNSLKRQDTWTTNKQVIMTCNSISFLRQQTVRQQF